MQASPQYPCDLHMHTTRSDGSDTPREFIDNAAAAGMKIVAITDHDIRPPDTIDVDGQAVSIVAYANSKGLHLLRGIEVSSETQVDETHIVLFGCNWKDPYFDALEDSVVQSKIKSYRELVDVLNAKGMPLTWEEVLDNNGAPVPEESVQKKMVFELIARKNYTPSWQDAKMMVKKDPDMAIKREKPAAVSVVKAAKKTGGISILAHPYLIAEVVAPNGKEMSRDEYIETMIEAGLDGIEAKYTYDKTSYGGSMTKEAIAEEVISKYGDRLPIISAGSDYHADHKKGVKNARQMGEAGLTLEQFNATPALAALLDK